MSKKICPRESEVLKALREEKMSEELQEHIAGCLLCQDTVVVSRWMYRFKETALKIDMPGKTLPGAQSMWNKAHAARRPDKKLVRKAMRPLIVPQVLALGVFIAGMIYMTVWGLKKFGNILESRVISQILPLFGIMMIIVFISLTFCAFVAALDKHRHPI